MEARADAPEQLQAFADPDAACDFSAYISLFGNATRLRLMCRLVCGGRASVGELVEWTGEPQPSISRQLKILWTGRLVEREKVGSRAFYSVSDPAVVKTMRFLASIASDIALPSGWSRT